MRVAITHKNILDFLEIGDWINDFEIRGIDRNKKEFIINTYNWHTQQFEEQKINFKDIKDIDRVMSKQRYENNLIEIENKEK